MNKLALLLVFLACCAHAAQSPAIEKYREDPGFTWKCGRQTHFELCWEASLDRDTNMAAARDGAEGAMAQVLRSAGLTDYDSLIYVFFVASPDRMEKLIGFHGEGRSRPAQHAIFFVPTPIRPDLTHELCHEILTNAWGTAEAWIEEGVASFTAEPDLVHQTCLSMMVRQAMLPLAELVRAEWNPGIYSPDITYVELGGFLEFLKQTYGLERVKQVWQQGSASIPVVLGKPVAALEQDWRRRLRREISRRSAPHR